MKKRLANARAVGVAAEAPGALPIKNEACLAAYFVHWTLGHVPDQGANMDMIIGSWGEGATAKKRIAVSLAYRLTETGPSLMGDRRARAADSSEPARRRGAGKR